MSKIALFVPPAMKFAGESDRSIKAILRPARLLNDILIHR